MLQQTRIMESVQDFEQALRNLTDLGEAGRQKLAEDLYRDWGGLGEDELPEILEEHLFGANGEYNG